VFLSKVPPLGTGGSRNDDQNTQPESHVSVDVRQRRLGTASVIYRLKFKYFANGRLLLKIRMKADDYLGR
jgi:hypothetical protein